MVISRSNRRTKNKKSTCHILLVEDQNSIASMTAEMLTQRWGFEVTIASSYAQAKAILEENSHEFFLTITDLNLPDASNGEIIDLLNIHDQPTIAITGFFEQDLHDVLRKKGVIDYVLKKNINAYAFLVQLVGQLYANQFITVMVVDDSVSLKKITRTYLEKQFLNVIEASNGEEGIALLKQHPETKLILVDSEMPLMDGLTFTATARQLNNKDSLSIIGISSSDRADLSSMFLKHGANDFISKPFSYDELTCRVNQNLNMLSQIDEIRQTAYHDFLTQLPNRRHFFTQGESIVKQAYAEQRYIAVGVLDIDLFKQFNDKYGHDCGDKVLISIAEVIKSTLVKHLFARVGGEEFAFIIRLPSEAETKTLIDQLLANIRALKVTYQAQKLSITASIGVTDTPANNLDTMLRAADIQLYDAKNQGRNQLAWQASQETATLN